MAALVFLVCPVFLNASDYQGKIIKEIHFFGLHNAEEDKLTPALYLSQGMEFVDEKASKDLKNLYEFGYFENIRLEIIEENGQLTLNYIVEERPQIFKIEIRKKKTFDDEDYEIMGQFEYKAWDEISIFDFEYHVLKAVQKRKMDEAKNQEDYEYIKKAYQKNEEDMIYELTSDADEDKVIEIFQSIHFQYEDPEDASLEIKRKDILKFMKNKEWEFYNPYYVKKDEKKILEEYVKEGFAETEARTDDSLLKDSGVLVIEIKEGKKINIQKLDILGTGNIDPDDLKDTMEKISEPRYLGIKDYQLPLFANDFKEDKDKMIKFAKSQGYMKFKIDQISVLVKYSFLELMERIGAVLENADFEGDKIEIILDGLKKVFETDGFNPDKAKIDSILKSIAGTDEQKKAVETIKTYIFNRLELLNNEKTILEKTLAEKLKMPDIKIEIKSETTVHPEEESGYYLSFKIEEGPQYTFGKIELAGNEKITTKSLFEGFDMEEGSVYNDTKFEEFMRNSYMSYQSNGFFYSKITPIPKVDEEKKVISYVIDIYEGEKVHIENMYIIGNSKTETPVIDREFRIREGEIYDFSKILRTHERLMKSQFFANAEFEPKTGSEEGLIDLFWKVEEGKTGMLTMGGGYGTLSGFTLFGQISELNFLGKGYNLSFRGDYGQKSQSLSTSFGSRWIGYIPVSYSFSISYKWAQNDVIPSYDRDHNGLIDKYYNNGSGMSLYNEGASDFDNYSDEDRNGDGMASSTADALDDERYFKSQSLVFGLGFGYSISEYWGAGARQSLSFSKYYDAKNITVDNLYEDDEYRLRTLLKTGKYEPVTQTGFSVSYDSTDNYLTPTKGIVFSPDVTFYGLQGGYNQFINYSVDLSGYLTLKEIKKYKWNLVWANHIGISTITALPFKNSPKLYSENRLDFDGIRELRGWENQLYDDKVKGLGKVSLGSELRIPIPGTQNLLWWAFFFDGGNVSDKGGFDDLPLKLKDFYYSTGWGLKIEIPMFPIRLYFAKRLKWEDGFFKDQQPGLGLGNWTFVLSIAGFF